MLDRPVLGSICALARTITLPTERAGFYRQDDLEALRCATVRTGR